jgi:hypothetical protein
MMGAREQRIAVGDLIISRRNGASIDVWHPTDEDKSVDLVRNGSPNASATATRRVRRRLPTTARRPAFAVVNCGGLLLG